MCSTRTLLSACTTGHEYKRVCLQKRGTRALPVTLADNLSPWNPGTAPNASVSVCLSLYLGVVGGCQILGTWLLRALPQACMLYTEDGVLYRTCEDLS